MKKVLRLFNNWIMKHNMSEGCTIRIDSFGYCNIYNKWQESIYDFESVEELEEFLEYD